MAGTDINAWRVFFSSLRAGQGSDGCRRCTPTGWLKQTADLATKTWVEAEAARLRRVQERLLDELRTYGREVGNLPGGGVAGSHRTTSASWGLNTGRRRVQNAVDRRQNASDPLRKLARDNEFLRLQVAEYRPVHGEV